jgi:Winged helix DNA-binding domain
VADVAVDGGTGISLDSDLEKTSDPGSSVALLPTLDTTIMGWSDRTWFLGEHGPTLFDRNGNGGPSIWVDGRVVGGWAQRKSGEVVYRLLEDVGKANTRQIEAEAARIESWLGESRIIPRFRTPLEQELSR